jgi:hypothetical protein
MSLAVAIHHLKILVFHITEIAQAIEEGGYIGRSPSGCLSGEPANEAGSACGLRTC